LNHAKKVSNYDESIIESTDDESTDDESTDDESTDDESIIAQHKYI
jgi:hypothetical protein